MESNVHWRTLPAARSAEEDARPAKDEPLTGTTVRAAARTLKSRDKRARTNSRQPLFGNRLRWAGRVLGEAVTRRRARTSR